MILSGDKGLVIAFCEVGLVEGLLGPELAYFGYLFFGFGQFI